MAQKAVEHLTPIKDLDAALRYLAELGYEKYPALCEMQERIWDGQLRLTRQRHVLGKPYSPTDGKPYNPEPVDPAFFRSKLILDFDHRHDRVEVVERVVGLPWDFRYRIAEGCDVRAIWPRLPASQTAPRQLEDKAGPDPVKADAGRTALSASDPPKRVSTKKWVTAEAIQLKKDNKIPAKAKRQIRHFAQLLAERMEKAAKADKTIRPVKWEHIKNMLPKWALWPVDSIKIS